MVLAEVLVPVSERIHDDSSLKGGGVGEEENPHSAQDSSPRQSAADGSSLLAVPIAQVCMPTRLKNALGRYGAVTLGDVLKVDESRFAAQRGVGATTIADLRMLKDTITGGGGALVTPPSPTHLTAPESDPLSHPPALQSPLSTIQMSGRLRKRLAHYGCTSICDLLFIDLADFSLQPGVGRTTLQELARLRQWIRQNVAGAAPQITDSDQHPPAPPTVGSIPELVSTVIADATLVRNRAQAQRDRDIWLAYYGISVTRRRTLEELANRYFITRERVRQIITRLTDTARSLLCHDERYGPQLDVLMDAFVACLGVASLDDLLRLIGQRVGQDAAPEPQHLRALSVLLEDTPHAFSFDSAYYIVRHTRACPFLWSELQAQLSDALANVGEGQHLLDFAHALGQRISSCLRPSRDGQDPPLACCGARSGRVRLPEAYVRALLLTVQPCPLHRDTVVGPDWAAVRFGRVKREVIAAALRIIGHPVHFTELAQFVREHNQHWQHADDRSIHACLSVDDAFIPTGRGVYGLREWGMERYLTVADRIEQYLRDRGRPTALATIIADFGAQGVSDAAIRAALAQNQHRLVQYTDGTVGLREWEQTGGFAGAEEESYDSLFVDDDEDEFILG